MRRFIPNFALSLYHYALALAAAVWYGFPAHKLTVIGVTGTNGKSTVVDLLHHTFVEAGLKTASASSLRFIVAKQEWQNKTKMTMPGRFFVQKFLRDAVRAGCSAAVLEVTSEGIKQFRHAFIDFDIVAITNLAPEHIESHGSFEKYRAAKLKLFEALAHSHKPKRTAVINKDIPNAEMFAKAAGSAAIQYFNAQDVLDATLKLEGEFNRQNALCAAATARAHGVSENVIKHALESAEPPAGRLQYVAREPFAVVVDYAHTPDALEAVYKTLKPQAKKLVCVLGAAGGGRDRWKRPEMGRVADKFCDEIILTNEDPYDEDPRAIIDEILKGVTFRTASLEIDRKRAIELAISKAKAGDTVIVTGKGAEPLMAVAGGKKIPWDDREVVRAALMRKTMKAG